MDPLQKFRDDAIAQMEAVGGRHDEPEIYDGEPGDQGLAGGPGSISWEINGDIGVIGAAGSAAIVMEVLHPSVMAGVYDKSSYRTQPLRRATNTLGYVLRTTFGSTPAATKVIERVKSIHSRIDGVRPDGVAYEALDPTLIAWVHTCIPWAVMTAFDRYRRPLSIDEKDRYLAEQAPIGRMGGADHVPESVAELEEFVAAIRPHLAVNEQTRSFIHFLAEGTIGDAAPNARERFDRWFGLRGAMTLMPEWSAELTGLQHGNVAARRLSDRYERFKAAAGHWACPVLPCEAMATRRATARSTGDGPDRESGIGQLRAS